MEKFKTALILTNVVGFAAIAALLSTGHSGFASKFANFFFFFLVAQTIYGIITKN